MNFEVAAFYGLIWFVLALGILALVKWREITREREMQAEQFWTEAMQPYLQSRGHDYSDDDLLNDQPLLPEDYRDWQK